MTTATIEALVRDLIHDPDAETFSDGEIQDVLKRLRWEARYMALDPIRSVASGGTVTYVTFTAPRPWQHWATDVIVYDSNYDALSPTSSDLVEGRWTMGSEPGRPVYVLGWSHDPYGAAADLLERRGAQLAEDLQTFSGANGSFSYANKRKGPLEQARLYRSMSRSSVSVGILVRTDTQAI